MTAERERWWLSINPDGSVDVFDRDPRTMGPTALSGCRFVEVEPVSVSAEPGGACDDCHGEGFHTPGDMDSRCKTCGGSGCEPTALKALYDALRVSQLDEHDFPPDWDVVRLTVRLLAERGWRLERASGVEADGDGLVAWLNGEVRHIESLRQAAEEDGRPSDAKAWTAVAAAYRRVLTHLAASAAPVDEPDRVRRLRERMEAEHARVVAQRDAAWQEVQAVRDAWDDDRVKQALAVPGGIVQTTAGEVRKDDVLWLPEFWGWVDVTEDPTAFDLAYRGVNVKFVARDAVAEGGSGGVFALREDWPVLVRRASTDKAEGAGDALVKAMVEATKPQSPEGPITGGLLPSCDCGGKHA
jgi:hypothetical protein